LRLRFSRDKGVIAFLVILLVVSLIGASLSLQNTFLIPSSGSIYNPPAAQVLFQDEFESGGFGAWSGVYTTTGDNATVVSTTPYQGVYAARFQTDALSSGAKYATVYQSISPAVSEVHARSYFYIANGLPLNDTDDRFGLIGFEVGGQLQCTFRIYRSDGVDRFNIVGLNGSSSVSASTDNIYPVEGKWYCVEFYIRVHSTLGEYIAWINGVRQLAITNVDTTLYGAGVSRVRVGLTYTANVQHYVEVLSDCAVMSTKYVGQLRYTFGVIGSVNEDPAIRNFYWLFGNQSISFRAISPSDVTRFEDVDRFDGLVVFTKHANAYNATAIMQFAQTRIVIAHMYDFCNTLYPSLSGSTQIVSTSLVTYVTDFGNFRSGDQVEMYNVTGNVGQLTTVLASGLSALANVTVIARYDASRIAYFHTNSMQPQNGFYVMDLDATTPTTEWAGIWHVFAPIKMVQDFPTGTYARWFADGIQEFTYDEVMSRLSSWVANAPPGMNASLIRIGKSVLGRDINATRFGNGSTYIMVDGCIHGNEKNSAPSLLRLLEVIQDNFVAGGYWKDRLSEVSVIVTPIVNPDGYVNNVRYNANGVDLNRQFPPGNTNTTEPEAWALRWLWGNYSPVVYVNLHEGGIWYPNGYYYSWTLPTNLQLASQQNCYYTKDDFEALKEWGYFTDGGNNVDIGKIVAISGSGYDSEAHIGAGYLVNASSYLIEPLTWSESYGARQILWATDHYVATILGLFSHFDRLRSDNFVTVTQGDIRSFSWNGTALTLKIDTSNLAPQVNCTSTFDLGGRVKPLLVLVDGTAKSEGAGWTYNSGTLTVYGAKSTIQVSW